jgi:FkbM family methyltransferase
MFFVRFSASPTVTINMAKGDVFHVATYQHQHPAFYMIIPTHNFLSESSANLRVGRNSLISVLEEKEYAFIQAVMLTMRKYIVERDQECSVLDVGANIGYPSLLAASLGCKVLSVEANPSTYQILKKNVRANSFEDTVKVYNYAIARESVELSFATRGKGSIYDHIMAKEDTANMEKNFHVTSVKGAPLHSIIPRATRSFDFVKIDCEGCEAMAIMTLRQFIVDGRIKMFIFEWVPKRVRKVSGQTSPEDMVELLTGNQYKVI